MINTLLLPELREMLETGDEAGLREFAGALHPARAAEFMEGLSAAETWQVLRAAEEARRVDIFGYLDGSRQVEIVESIAPGEMAPLMAELPADDRVDLLNDVDNAVVEEMLPLMGHEDRRETLRLLEHAEGTAGSLMTTEVAKLSENLTVHQALEEISRQAENLETVYYNYIVDDANHLRGLISARQLVTHYREPNLRLADLAQRDVVTVHVDDDQEAVAKKVANYNFLAIPVVDDERRLLGIITHDDIIDVLREEATEDAHMAGGVARLDDSYLDTPWYTLVWKRVIWLAVLFFFATFTISALTSFEHTLEKLPWLMAFVPLVLSSGGNTGNQSATLVITAMTNGELKAKDWWRVIRRELVMGLSLGLLLSIMGLLCVSIYAWRTSATPDSTLPIPSLRDMLVVPITLISVALCGALCGGALPLLFRRLGLDPALMSNPFVSGICDVAGIMIYMTVALLLLPQLAG